MLTTPKRRFVFGTLMALVMVYGMEVYNGFLRGQGSSAFAVHLLEYLGILAIVMVLQAFVGGPLAHKLVRYFTGGAPNRFWHMPVFTVLVMCPSMSLIVTMLFHPIGYETPALWLTTFAYYLPMAFAWQMLVAGPLVRAICHRLFAPMALGRSAAQ